MAAVVRSFKVLEDNSYHGVGKRKDSIARVWLIRNSSGFIVKARDSQREYDMREYLQRDSSFAKVLLPLNLTNTNGKFGVYAILNGGGLSGQAEAIMYAIADALLAYNSNYRITLKRAGLLKVDARIKERKKYGKMGARAKFRWSKR
jgi:small subunit ribosomal protein S9